MAKSIFQTEKECWACHTTQNLHEHHIFYGTAYRKQSERFGLKVWLCVNHHEGNEGIHGGHNHELDLELKQMAQRAMEQKYNHYFYMDVFDRNYLDEEEWNK